MKKKIGVVLSGCGVYDGAEIHESTLTLLAIDREGAEAICMAPDMDQMHVVNHITGEVDEEQKRNVLVEAARIARGNIKNIADVKVYDIDGLIFPGGFGAAKNLCDFAIKGESCEAHPEVIRLVTQFASKKKPQVACCIAPVIMAKIFEGKSVKPRLTIGNDRDVGEKIKSMGSEHQDCNTDDIVYDENNKIVTTPAYMTGQSISQVADGIEKAVKKLISLL